MTSNAQVTKGRQSAGWFVVNNFGLLLIGLMIIFGAIFANNFFSLINIQNLLTQIAVNGILTVGFSVVYIVDGFDLSMGNVLSACAVVSLTVLNTTHSILLTFLSAFAVGVTFGFANGMIGKVIKSDGSDSYLITLAMSLVALGFAYIFSHGLNIQCDNSMTTFRNISRGRIFGIPNSAIIMAVFMIVVHLALRKTTVGRKLYYVGANRKAAYMSGINSHNYRMYAFMFSGFCAALAAIVMIARTGSANPMIGNNYETDAAIATIVGGNSPGDAKSGMLRSLFGILCLGLIRNIMNMMNIDANIQTVTKCIVLLVALYALALKQNWGGKE